MAKFSDLALLGVALCLLAQPIFGQPNLGNGIPQVTYALVAVFSDSACRDIVPHSPALAILPGICTADGNGTYLQVFIENHVTVSSQFGCNQDCTSCSYSSSATTCTAAQIFGVSGKTYVSSYVVVLTGFTATFFNDTTCSSGAHVVPGIEANSCTPSPLSSSSFNPVAIAETSEVFVFYGCDNSCDPTTCEGVYFIQPDNCTALPSGDSILLHQLPLIDYVGYGVPASPELVFIGFFHDSQCTGLISEIEPAVIPTDYCAYNIAADDYFKISYVDGAGFNSVLACTDENCQTCYFTTTSRCTAAGPGVYVGTYIVVSGSYNAEFTEGTQCTGASQSVITQSSTCTQMPAGLGGPNNYFSNIFLLGAQYTIFAYGCQYGCDWPSCSGYAVISQNECTPLYINTNFSMTFSTVATVDGTLIFRGPFLTNSQTDVIQAQLATPTQVKNCIAFDSNNVPSVGQVLVDSSGVNYCCGSRGPYLSDPDPAYSGLSACITGCANQNIKRTGLIYNGHNCFYNCQTL